MQHARDTSNERSPRVRAVAVPAATSVEAAPLFAAIILLALLVLLL